MSSKIEAKGATRAAMVTGGAAGIGIEIAAHLADEGWAVIAVDCSRQACEAATQRFIGRPNFKIIEADIASEEGATIAAVAAIDSFGRIDLLCNNAAYHPIETIEAHSYETWRETFRVNVDGTMLCSRAVLPHMRRQGGGAIVNIGSISGILSYAGGAAYAASKAAIAMFTKTLALEVGPHNIRVNCICPGSIARVGEVAAETGIVVHIPIGRKGQPEDVARLVSFLASVDASYLTGAIIPLDGGATAGRAKVSKRRDPAQ